ncbi:MAG TPA: cytochrome c [Bryobacteraceae bacterium]|nr:cytochrome c [Bryobacteraceae bacterium]
MQHLSFSVMPLALPLAILFAGISVGQSKNPGDLAGNAESGKAVFVKNGCYQCHGYQGQGGFAGARLMQTKLSQTGFIGFVRNPPPGGMPQFRAKIMPDQELADVYAYIKSIPEPKPVKDIPLLNGL